MVVVVILTLAALTVDLLFSGIMLIADLGNLGLSLVPGALLITGLLLVAWLIHD
ncbi:MAG: hypothetical protein VKO01_05990 [Cyanobacteriota bacterium]|jgi:hypothetical protein|nr:hypothetical protein [Cyanobacteriota bacterium]